MKITKIKGFERYTISKDGTIFDIKRNKVIKQTWHKKDRAYQVALYDDKGKRYFKKLHRLLAENFNIPNPNGYKYVLHKDDNRIDICLDNLYYSNNKRSNNINAYNTSIEPIYNISAYQELRETLEEMQVDNNILKNINDDELEQVQNELFAHQAVREIINDIITRNINHSKAL